MEVIVTSQYRSARVWIVSKGKDVWSAGDPAMVVLDSFLKWLKDASGDPRLEQTEDGEVVIYHRNAAGIDTQRTAISCDPGDRPALLEALKPLVQHNTTA